MNVTTYAIRRKVDGLWFRKGTAKRRNKSSYPRPVTRTITFKNNCG